MSVFHEKVSTVCSTAAHDLAKEQKVNYGDDLACMIRVARKRRFNVAEEKRISQEIELQVRLFFLISLFFLCNEDIIEERSILLRPVKFMTSVYRVYIS